MDQKSGSENYRFSLDQQANELLARLESESPQLYHRVLEQARNKLERITEEAKSAGRIIQTDHDFNKPTYLNNELVVREAPHTFVYVGEAIDLWFDKFLDVRGKAQLTKYEREEKIGCKKKLIWGFPPKLETQEVSVVKDKQIWSIVSGLDNFKYFLNNGQLTGYYNGCSAYYKIGLQGNATSQGINLPLSLIDAVFAPIAEKIMEMYQQLNK